MSIIVVCPGCLKSFKVSDKFAGRTGPCPNCKRTLKVPEKSEEVTVHAPEAFAGGGRSASGKLIVEPVAFRPAKLEPVKAALIVATVFVVLAITWLGGRTGLFANLLATTAGLLVVSPFLVVAAYTILPMTSWSRIAAGSCTCARPCAPWPTWLCGASSPCWWHGA